MSKSQFTVSVNESSKQHNDDKKIESKLKGLKSDIDFILKYGSAITIYADQKLGLKLSNNTQDVNVLREAFLNFFLNDKDATVIRFYIMSMPEFLYHGLCKALDRISLAYICFCNLINSNFNSLINIKDITGLESLLKAAPLEKYDKKLYFAISIKC